MRDEILPATWDAIKLAEQAYQDGDTSYLALLYGCLLVVAILVVFLFEWRTAAISRTAIPLSILDAAVVLHYQGGPIIVRRLPLNSAAGNPESPFQVVLQASMEVRSAVAYASLIVVIRLCGPSLEVLRAKAQEVGKALLDDPDIANLQAEFQVLVPQVEVRVGRAGGSRKHRRAAPVAHRYAVRKACRSALVWRCAAPKSAWRRS